MVFISLPNGDIKVKYPGFFFAFLSVPLFIYLPKGQQGQLSMYTISMPRTAYVKQK